MKSEDDPEARIRELEQPLAETARASEVGVNPPPGKWAAPPAPAFPAPPQQLPYRGSFPSTSPTQSSRNRVWWILAAFFIIGTVAIPLGLAFLNINRATHSGLTTLLPNPGVSSSSAAPSAGAAQTPVPAPAMSPTAPAGASLSIAGINSNRAISCNGGVISVSGVSNTVVITGHCASLSVSGVQNKVTVEAVDSIEASGFNNQITYHTGSPSIDKSGDGNVVQQG
jgi:hypothetical protein